MSLKTFLSKILTAVEKFFGEVKDESAVVLNDANAIVNKLKAEAATPTGQVLETLLTDIIPANIMAGLKTALAAIFTGLKFATAEEAKPEDAIIADGIAEIGKLSGDIKAAQLNSIQALVSTHLGTATGVPIPIQQSLTAAQIVYDPSTDTLPVVAEAAQAAAPAAASTEDGAQA